MSRIERGDGWEMRLGRWEDSPVEVCDHVICDPPYSEHVHRSQRRNTPNGVSSEDIQFDPLSDMSPIFRLTSTANRWCIAWCAVEDFGAIRDAVGGWRKQGGFYVRSGAWMKTNPMPQITGDRPAQWGEGCAIMHSVGGRMKWNGGGLPAKWVGPTKSSGDTYHQTPKPLWLMQQQIEQFTDPGDLIWDPYAGSATTGVACLITGRRFIGHEMQERYFEIACDRLRATNRGTTLDAARAGQMTLIDAMGVEG